MTARRNGGSYAATCDLYLARFYFPLHFFVFLHVLRVLRGEI
jgi:hypothetical protein